MTPRTVRRLCDFAKVALLVLGFAGCAGQVGASKYDGRKGTERYCRDMGWGFDPVAHACRLPQPVP